MKEFYQTGSFFWTASLYSRMRSSSWALRHRWSVCFTGWWFRLYETAAERAMGMSMEKRMLLIEWNIVGFGWDSILLRFWIRHILGRYFWTLFFTDSSFLEISSLALNNRVPWWKRFDFEDFLLSGIGLLTWECPGALLRFANDVKIITPWVLNTAFKCEASYSRSRSILMILGMDLMVIDFYFLRFKVVNFSLWSFFVL